MKRRDFIKAAGLSALSVALTGSKRVEETQARPNILFVMSDDHAANGISCYGSKINRTPNIDRLAEEGMRFNNCFCTNSICTPSRATILTGKYGHKNGCANLDATFDGSQQTFPKLLQKAGYYTGVIGKWHLASEPTGFDYYNVLPGQGRYFDPRLKEKGKPWKDGFAGGEVYKGYCTDVIADQVLKFLQNRPVDKPFCLLYHNKAPHDMWNYDEKHAHLYEETDVPEPETLFDNYKNRSGAIVRDSFFKIGMGDLTYNRKTGHLTGVERKKAQYQIFIKAFLRCVASIDDNLGRVLDYLDISGLTENTVVIYTSDQGAFLGEHGLWDKRFMYEESLRMPFVIRFPDGIKPGSVNNDIVTNVDFAETLLDYGSAQIPPDMQGRSFRSLCEGNRPEDWPTSIYYHYPEPGSIPAHYGIRTEWYKLIYYYGMARSDRGEGNQNIAPMDPEWELFDLKEDPYEMKNLYGDPKYDDLIKELKSELLRLKKDLGDEDRFF